MIEAQTRRIDKGPGDPHCFRLSAVDPLPELVDGGRRCPKPAPFGAGQTDAALSTSSSRPAPHCLTAGPGRGPGSAWSPIAASLKVLLPTTPEPIAASGSVCFRSLPWTRHRVAHALHRASASRGLTAAA